MVLSFLPSVSFAAPSAELRQVLEDVLEWVPGAYESAPQIAYERVNGSPADGEHDRQYRIFARITAPHLGEYVFYSQIRAGGIDGPVVQQVVFLIDLDEKNNGVKFNGRRIKDAENYVDAHKNPEMWKTIFPDPRFGGNCDFFWRRHGSLLKGTFNDGTCAMVSRNTNQKMTWHTEWVLSPDELWVYDNGYYDDGTLVTGRADKAHLRLYKASDFSCIAKGIGKTAAGAQPTQINVHDRGGVAQIRAGAGKKPPLYLDLTRGPVVNSDGDIHDEMRLSLYERDPTDDSRPRAIARASAAGQSRYIALQTVDSDIACSRVTDVSK